MEEASGNAIWISAQHANRRIRPRRLLLASDLLAACIAAVALYLVARGRSAGLAQMGITSLTGGLILALSLLLVLRARQYSVSRRLRPLTDIAALVTNLVLAAGATTLISYLTKGFFTGLTTPSRMAVGTMLVTFFGLALASRLILAELERRQYLAKQGVRRILLAGEGYAASEFVQLVGSSPFLGATIVGRLSYGVPEHSSVRADPVGASTASSVMPPPPHGQDLPVVILTDNLEGLERLHEALRAWQVTEVVVALDPEENADLPGLANLLTLAHVPFRVVPSLFEEIYRVTELLGHPEIPVIDVETGSLDRLNRIAKRTLDVCVAALGLVLLAPLLLVISAAIALESGLPVFYSQERLGKNARRFSMYKFRTMIKNADAKLAELQSQNEAAASNGRLFKMREDPRVTRVGSVLRRFSLDELPQFVNVLRGDMSVVGPRPPLPQEVQQYEREHLYRLRALPGITGLWQVSGRSDLSFEDLVRLDRHYLDNWSLRLDLSIMFRTLKAMVSRKGAY